MSKLSKCKKCSNIPCRENRTIFPDSVYLVSSQFKIDFDWDIGGELYVRKCNGFNKKNFLYKEDNNENQMP